MSNGSKTWLSIHAYLTMFFLPIAVIYAVTGGISALEGHEEHGMRPGLPPGMADGAPARSTHAQGSITSIHTEGPEEGFRSEGGPGERGPGGMKDRGLYGKLLLLHKAKGSPAFSVMGVAFACALLVMYVSGIWIGWKNQMLRGRMLIFAALGLLVTVVVLATSA